MPKLKQELEDYYDMLLGRVPLPIDNGVLSLMESAVAMYVRVSEIAAMIHRGEQEGTIMRTSSWFKFRNGEVKDFLDSCKRAIELGSRRVTAARSESEMREWS